LARRSKADAGQIVQIISENRGGSIVAVVRAQDKRAALSEHYENALRPKGFKNPRYLASGGGQSMTVASRQGDRRVYRAR
jgi:hypothetical protein